MDTRIIDTSKFFTATFLCAVLSIPTISNAALIERDLDGDVFTAEAYYDDESNLTWLTDASDTSMLYFDAESWVSTLSVGGVGGWRLPTSLDYDASCDVQRSLSFVPLSEGYNCIGGEMGNLYYSVLANDAGGPAISNPFNNVGFDLWTSKGMASLSQIYNWTFNMSDGFKGQAKARHWEPAREYRHAWAVQTGSVGVAVSTIPSPTSIWLFTTGLILLVSFVRRKKHA